MSTNPFADLQPRLTALTQGMSGNSMRAQQALVTFLFSAAQAQFGFSRGLAEDMTEAFKANPTTNPAAAIQTVVNRWHDRSEQAITEFRHISDELRNNLYESVAQPLAQISAAASEATEKVTEAVKAASPVAPSAKTSAKP
ncbi:MAG: hypothetical protein AB7E55_22660 [Pigmentiphaga sp.]